MKQDKITQLSSWLAASDGYVSGEELAMLLHTTARTIRNYVFEINASAKEEPLILTSRKGYCWNIPDGSMPLVPKTEKPTPYSPSERASYITRQLLCRKNILYDTLMDKLMVSSHTLDSDLAHVKEILRPFCMTLHRRGEHFYLKGRQMDRRRLIANTILRTCNISYLSIAFLENVYSNISAKEIYELLEQTFQGYGLSCTGQKYYELVLHIMIQAKQIQDGNVITQRETAFSLNDLEAYPDYSCAMVLAKELERISGCPYSLPEREYLALLLIAKAEDCFPILHDIPLSASKLYLSADRLVARLEKYLHANFSQDSFTAWLSMYLYRMIIRQKLQLSRPDQLRSKMRSAYPALYRLTANFLFDFSKKIDVAIRSDEVCGLSVILASHIQDNYVFEASLPCSLVLPVKPSLAEHIQSKLSARMGSVLDIRQVLLQTDLAQISQDTRLVLSLIPLQHHPHCVQISPFPKSADFQNIYREILHIKMEGYINRLKAYLDKYLTDSHFIYSATLKSRKDVIHCACSQLVKEGIVSSEYEDNLIDSENFESSGVDDLVSVPFTAHPSVSRDCVFVVTTKEHIPWLSGKISLFFFLICRDSDNCVFHDLYDLLVKIFCRPHNVQRIAGSKSAWEMLKALDQLNVKK